MKRYLLLVIGFLFFLSMQNCVKEYDEFGEDSVFYYLNGSPVIPTCSTGFTTNKMRVSLLNDTLRVHICGNVQIDYEINHYQGKGLYEINSTNQNTCTITKGFTQYYAIDNHKTFMRVLELDTITKHFSAVFEANLIDGTGHFLKITKGRMDVKYND